MSDEAKEQLAENDLHKCLKAENAALKAQLSVREKDYIDLCEYTHKEQKAAWNLSQQLQKEVMRREEMEAENARLRKDKARLDWLEENQDVYFVRTGSTVQLLTTDHDLMQDQIFVEEDGLRAAIDIARKGEEG